MFVEASAPICDNKEANVTNIYIFKELAMHFNILRSKCRGSPIYIIYNGILYHSKVLGQFATRMY